MANADESPRQDVEQEPPQELLRVQTHDLGTVLIRVILPLKIHVSVGHCDEPGVGDGYSMGITAQVAKDLFGTTKGPLGVDDPIPPIQVIQPATKPTRIGQNSSTTSQPESPGLLSRYWPEATRTLKLTSVTLLCVLEQYGGPQALAVCSWRYASGDRLELPDVNRPRSVLGGRRTHDATVDPTRTALTIPTDHSTTGLLSLSKETTGILNKTALASRRTGQKRTTLTAMHPIFSGSCQSS